MKDTKGRGRPVGSTKKKDAAKPVKEKKLAVKETKPKKRQPKKETKVVKKDPNQPKRPPTAFFIFLEEFRQTYKEQHPDVKGVAAVGKAGGDKWKQMSEAEKSVFNKQAAQRRADYDKTMAAYRKKQEDEEEQASAEESKENEDESAEEQEDEDDEDAD